MGSTDAVAATSKAILGLLEDAWVPGEVPKPAFALFHGSDFDNPKADRAIGSLGFGVSLFLYRVAVNGSARPAPRQLRTDGYYYRAPLLVDLYYLVTAWADDVERQQRLLGWCMRTLYDTPILPAAHLNAHSPDRVVFKPEESVELIPETLAFQDLAAVWDKLKPKLQTSATYLARMVALESAQPPVKAARVQTRDFAIDGVPEAFQAGIEGTS